MKGSAQRIIRAFNPISPPTRTVNFIICGTQKGGTSALDAYLREHPDICMADRKETHYFDDENHFANGNPDHSKYRALFSPSENHKLLGEATPIYMYWNESPRRIWEYNPAMKLIVILRNPIERAYSHWNMDRTKNAEYLSFGEAIETEIEGFREALPIQDRVFSYIDRGHYLVQLRRLWEYFPKERVLIFKNEDLLKNPTGVLNQVAGFLEIACFERIAAKNVHSTPYASRMTKNERTRLKSIFEPGIRELEKELGWTCSDWLD